MTETRRTVTVVLLVALVAAAAGFGVAMTWWRGVPESEHRYLVTATDLWARASIKIMSPYYGGGARTAQEMGWPNDELLDAGYLACDGASEAQLSIAYRDRMGPDTAAAVITAARLHLCPVPGMPGS